MRLREFINSNKEYEQIELELNAWMSESYTNLILDFDGRHVEIVQKDDSISYHTNRVQEITREVNAKIGELLEAYAERIQIAEWLDRIYKRHPKFDLDVGTIDDIKTHPIFLSYLKELKIS